MSDVARFMRDPTRVKAAQEGLRRFHWLTEMLIWRGWGLGQFWGHHKRTRNVKAVISATIPYIMYEGSL